MILVHFFAVFIFMEAGLFAKIAKICTQWRFPAIRYSNSPAPRNLLENSLWTSGYKMQREGPTFSMVAWNGTRVVGPYPQMPCLLQVPATACWTLVSKSLSWLSMAESGSRSVPVETGNILAHNRLLLSLYQDCKDFRSHSNSSYLTNQIYLCSTWGPTRVLLWQWTTVLIRGVHSICKKYNFTHSTSSPRYPQANGEAEWAVRKVKNILKTYLGLMVYQLHLWKTETVLQNC